MRKLMLIAAAALAVAAASWFFLRPSVPTDQELAGAAALIARAGARRGADGLVAAVRVLGRRRDGPTFADMRLAAGLAFLPGAAKDAAEAAVEVLDAHPDAGAVGAIMLWSDCTSGPLRNADAPKVRAAVEEWLRRTAAVHPKEVTHGYFAFIAREEDMSRRSPVEHELYSKVFVK